MLVLRTHETELRLPAGSRMTIGLSPDSDFVVEGAAWAQAVTVVFDCALERSLALRAYDDEV